jgi:hypothetical protein
MDMFHQIRQDNRIVRINKQEEKFHHGKTRKSTDKNGLTQSHKDTKITKRKEKQTQRGDAKR